MGRSEYQLTDILTRAGQAGKHVILHVDKANRAREWYKRLGFYSAEDRGLYELMACDPGGS